MSNSMGLRSAIAIGVGGMVGGGIFAVLGLAISLARGGTPVAFLFAGIIALATAYSYAKLSKKYPEDGGTVTFLNTYYGEGTFAGAINNLLWISYIVMLALYASAFGSYAAELYSLSGSKKLDTHVYQTGILVLALLINYFSVKLVSAVESVSVVIKMLILTAFIGVGMYGIQAHPAHLSQLSPAQWQAPVTMLTGGLVIFVAYEGFELIANSISELKNREANTERAYFWAVGIVLVLYILIAAVTVASLSFAQIAQGQEYVLALAAKPTLGQTGFTIITATAMISTFSAINATVMGSGRINYDIAEERELPRYFCRHLWGKPLGYSLTALFSILLVNTFNLQSISTAGSAGFLVIFTAVNYVAFRMHRDLHSRRWIHAAAGLFCAAAFIVLEVQQFGQNRVGVWVSLGIITGCFALEWLYQKRRHTVRQ